MGISEFGNELHTGQRTLHIVQKRRWWYIASIAVVIVMAAITGLRGLNLGIEFTGGSEFQLNSVSDTSDEPARDVVADHPSAGEAKVTVIGGSTLLIQTERLTSDETTAMQTEFADAYGISVDDVTSSFIGPTWGSEVTGTALRAVVVFIVLVGVVMAVYFRNWKSSLAAILALVHDMLVTAGVYGAVGFEITPAAVIGFLTILGYSIYDTVVVFDKVRENCVGLLDQSEYTLVDAVNRAVNQTLIRSINTSVVALLPVGSILFIGAFVLGAGTLKDIALALFVGIIAGAYSSIFIAPSLVVDLRSREKGVRDLATRVSERAPEPSAA